jgi:hypothetical protein
MNQPLQCWNCGAPLADVPQPMSRHEHCPQCFEALHCCRLCRHYDMTATGQCNEDRAEPPGNKESANFCEWFSAREGAGPAAGDDKQADARRKLEDLFGGPRDADPD